MRLARGRIHRFAFIDRQRHRLFHDHMLAGLRGSDGVTGVILMGRGDVNSVEIGALTHLFDGLIGRATELVAERF